MGIAGLDAQQRLADLIVIWMGSVHFDDSDRERCPLAAEELRGGVLDDVVANNHY